MAYALVRQLRVLVQDDRFILPAFSIQCTDTLATEAKLTIANGVLSTTVLNGSSGARELRLDLSDPDYATLGKLVQYLRGAFKATQYRVYPDADMESGHPSLDLEELTSVDIRSGAYQVRTRRFASSELELILQQAVRRHNPGYMISNVPATEESLVLQIAQGAVLRVLASDAVRRRGLAEDVETLLALAASHEKAYQADVRRLARVIQSPKADDDGIREGDAVVGEISRRSMRTGHLAGSAAGIPPKKPLLYDPSVGDTFDYAVRLRWRRSTESLVYAQELWRDTQPNVRRTSDASAAPTTSVCVWSTRYGTVRDYENAGTINGKLVSSFFDGFRLPELSQTIPEVVEGALAPETTYFYRLYLIQQSGEWAASDVIEATTKPARAEFSRDTSVPYLDVKTGPRAGGTSVVMRGSGFATSNPTVTLGGASVANQVVVDDTTITFDTPPAAPRSPAQADVVLTSATGLFDMSKNGWSWS